VVFPWSTWAMMAMFRMASIAIFECAKILLFTTVVSINQREIKPLVSVLVF